MFLLVAAICIGGIDSKGVEKIIGGKEVKIGSFPYMLSLGLSGTYACSACIIDHLWAVTAAHCVHAANGNLSRLGIRSGSSNWNAGGILHNVTSARVHEKFNVNNEDNDIAMIKMDPPFSFNGETQPIILGDVHSDVDTSWGWVAGWGYTNEFRTKLSSELMAVAVPLVESGECIRDYQRKYQITKEQVCYGLRKGGADACKGDSGSPLVNKDFVLIGIASWGEGCGEGNSPGVYTNALLYKNWILQTIQAKAN